MLSDTSAAVVAATLPAVQEHGVAITSTFYASMFKAHPELLDLFNQGNQAQGDQSRALAASVAAFAEHLLGRRAVPFDQVFDRIAHKHVSLGVRPAQYTIVGRHLMGAVGSVLGDAVTPDVAAAWDEVYWLFATRLVAAEARLYQRTAVDPADPWRPWTVEDRIEEAEDVISLVLVPTDGGALPDFLPGQYVTVVVDLPGGRRQPRQYTITSAPGEPSLTITVRRVRGVGSAPDGAVSTHLHESVAKGDELLVGHPAGEVVLTPGTSPVVLISAGIGVTPMAAMLKHLARTEPDREVVAVHADRSPSTHALHDAMRHEGARLRTFRQLRWYEEPDEPIAADARHGLVDPESIPLPGGCHAYLCGPLPFMRDVRASLLHRGVPAEHIRYEVFGPDLWAGTPEG